MAASSSRLPNRLVTWVVSGAIICVFLVLDYAATPIMKYSGSDWLRTLLVGACIAELHLIAVWAVLAPGNLVVRLPWSLLLTAAMWYSFVIGNRQFDVITLSNAIIDGEIMFAAMIVAQIPLWVAKGVFRWRLIRGISDADQWRQGPWQFHIRHLLVATFLLALAMSPLRSVLPPGPADRYFSPAIGILVLGTFLVCNLAVTVPCIWGAFASAGSAVPLALGWLVSCGVLTFLEFMAWPGTARGKGLLLFLLLNLSQAATVFGMLLIYRAIGFRFVRARPSNAEGIQPSA
jgi:hypothetical protein